MAGPRVPVLAPDPKTGRMRFATVDESEADIVVQSGGKLLTKGEADVAAAEQRQAERADKAGIAGTAQTAVGAIGGVLNPLMFSGGAGSTGEAFNQGVTSGLTAGLSDVAERKALDATAGPGAGARFAQQRDDIKAASPVAHTVGEVTGFTAGAAALPASPAGIIGKAGGLAERGAGLVLRGGGGALKQAATTGAKMALRGGVEAGIASGVQSVADDLVHDNEINGEKAWTMMKHGAATGAVLGGGLGFSGSLAVSGAKAAGRGLIRGLSKAGGEESGIAKAFGDADGAASRVANEQAWKAAGGGYGLQSTRYAKQAAKYFPNGTADVGEAAIRHGVIDIPQGLTPTQAAMHAAKTGTPAEMLPRAQAALDRVGSQLGEITGSSGGRVSAGQILGAVEETVAPYAQKAGFSHVESGVRNYGSELAQKLGLRSLDDTVSVRDLLFQRKALDQLVYQEAKALDPGGRVGALRELRGKIESIITSSLDEASGQVPGHVKGRYEGLKADYHRLSVLNEALEDSAARAAKASTLGLGEKFAVAQAVAGGHLMAAPVLGLGGKLIRERGNAAAAAYLSRAAEQQTFSKLVRKAEKLLDDAVTGSIAEAPSTPRKLPSGKRTANDAANGRAQHEATRNEAQAIVKWTSDVAASPQSTLSRLQETAATIGRHAGPRAAAAYSMSSIKAMQFVSRYVPARDRRDPLDPRSVPPLTMDESQSLVRAHRYATEPRTVWEDFAKGIVTPEGLDAAQSLMPEQFAEFQIKLFAHVQEHMLKNKQITEGQRLRIDKLLGGAAIRPDDIARSQQDFQDAPPTPNQGPAPSTGNKPVDMPIQQSGFDQVEMRKAQ